MAIESLPQNAGQDRAMGETPETDPLLETRPAELPLASSIESQATLPESPHIAGPNQSGHDAPASDAISRVQRAEPPEPPPAAMGDIPLPVSERSDRELGLEVCIVLAVVVLPGVFSAFTPIFWPREDTPVSSVYDSLYLLVRELGPVALVLYLVHRSGEPAARFGLVRPRWIGDLLAGGGIWLTDYLVWLFIAANCWSIVLGLESAFPLLHPAPACPAPLRWHEYLLAALGACAVGFSEELVMRGFMLPRLEQLLRSTWKALLLTTVIFASWHAYQGMRGIVSAGVTGLICGAAFCWLRRLWPIAVAHALADFLAVTRAL